MMLHPYTHTITMKDETSGLRRAVGRLAVVATIERGMTCDSDYSTQWYVSAIATFALGDDGAPSATEFPIDPDDGLHDVILSALLRDEDGAITQAWVRHLAGSHRQYFGGDGVALDASAR